MGCETRGGELPAGHGDVKHVILQRVWSVESSGVTAICGLVITYRDSILEGKE
jgi:hypothetical protein